MARAIQDGRVTPADELRELLAECEKLLANLRGHGSNSLNLLRHMDRIAALLPELEGGGADLRSEAGRWEMLQSAVRTNKARIVRQLRGVGGLPALRAEAHPDGREQWWWRLDQEVASQTALAALGVTGLGVVGHPTIARFSGPLPRPRAGRWRAHGWANQDPE
jgi:hypothetical protein